MDFLRPFMVLFAVVALFLAVVPGMGAHAAGIGMGTAIASTHHDADGCAKAGPSHPETDKHGAGDCAKMLCCLGTACVFAGLPATMVFDKPLSIGTAHLSAVTTLLTGRDVAPPLDPPKSFV